jgi:hypothetical protein
LKRVKAGNSLGFTYWRSAITLGICMSSEGEWTSRSYVATTSTRSRKIALIAVCHGHRLSG